MREVGLERFRVGQIGRRRRWHRRLRFEGIDFSGDVFRDAVSLLGGVDGTVKEGFALGAGREKHAMAVLRANFDLAGLVGERQFIVQVAGLGIAGCIAGFRGNGIDIRGGAMKPSIGPRLEIMLPLTVTGSLRPVLPSGAIGWLLMVAVTAVALAVAVEVMVAEFLAAKALGAKAAAPEVVVVEPMMTEATLFKSAAGEIVMPELTVTKSMLPETAAGKVVMMESMMAKAAAPKSIELIPAESMMAMTFAPESVMIDAFMREALLIESMMAESALTEALMPHGRMAEAAFSLSRMMRGSEQGRNHALGDFHRHLLFLALADHGDRRATILAGGAGEHLELLGIDDLLVIIELQHVELLQAGRGGGAVGQDAIDHQAEALGETQLRSEERGH